MKNLILVRHGKSGYDNFTTDKNREISEIGIERTTKVALNSSTLITDSTVFWTSSATRAASTAAIFADALAISKNLLLVKDELYTFNVDGLKSAIQSIPDHIDKIMLFGHNPAFTNFINDCTNLKIDNLPTSGLVSIEFETQSWRHLPKGLVVKTLFAKDL